MPLDLSPDPVRYDHPVAMRFPSSDVEAVRRIAKEHGVSASAVFRAAVRQVVRQELGVGAGK